MSILLTLGPAHPLWPGPQQLALRVADETVIDVDYRADEGESALAHLLTRGDLARALHSLTSDPPRHAFAHGLALCEAAERLAAVEAPPVAAVVRVAAAEVERLASHVSAAAMLLGLMGLTQRHAELIALSQAAGEALSALAGERPVGLLAPGGLSFDPGEERRLKAREQLGDLGRSLYRAIDRLIDSRLLLARTVGVGVLSRAAAEQFGVRGPVARASGIARDVRVDHPYAAYAQLQPKLITQEGGDVYARLVLLLLEAFESFKLAERALDERPGGAHAALFPGELPAGRGEAQVEGPIGMLRYQIEAEGGRLRQVRIDAPRQLDRLLARTLLDRALVDNGLLIAASVAPYAGDP